jgi:PRTRC genetic system protein F
MSTIEAHTLGPVSLGCFCLPAIDADIPTALDEGAKRREILSRFAVAAAAEGVKLPAGDFRSIEQVVQAQWQQYVNSYADGTFGGLAGLPAVEVTDEKLTVVIESRSTLNAYQLKPVVEALEKSQAGLGWFVEAVISSASYFGHELYTMGFVAYMLDNLHWNVDEHTDDAYARAMLMEEGSEPPEGPIPPETMDRLRQDYNYWPSTVLAEVDGHGHLLSWGRKPKTTLKPAQARRWLAHHPRHKHAKAVNLALQVQAMFSRAKRDFTWCFEDDDIETIGALAFVAWDSPRLLFEAVNHHEECQYQGGQAVEAFARCQVKTNSETIDADLRHLARATVNYMRRWALLEALLSQFPTWEGDDDV